MYPDRNVIMVVFLVCLSEYGDTKWDLHEMMDLPWLYPILHTNPRSGEPWDSGSEQSQVTSETKVETTV